MTKVVVLVPRRGGGWRDTVWEAIRPDIEDLGYPVVVADSPGTEIFQITKAWNEAARLAEDWDHAILHLADHCMLTPKAVHRAVELDHPGIRWCFDKVLRLSQYGSEMLIQGKRDLDWPTRWLRARQLPYPLVPPYSTYEGPRVVSRELWDRLGGFDERSVGWGAEDQLFSVQANKIHPDMRVPGVLADIWHPKQPNDESDPYYSNRKANRQLLKEALKRVIADGPRP